MQLKFKNLLSTALVLSLSLMSGIALAAPTPTPSKKILDLVGRSAESAGYSSNTTEFTLAGIVGSVVQVFLSLIGVIFISYTIYGGYLWMTAAGSEEKVTKAKDIIRNGIIGMIVVFATATIYYFVMTIFGNNNLV